MLLLFLALSSISLGHNIRMKKLKSGATDDNGRLRLHGAFTGGFSAGYFNTVGTTEGFKPATFVSSRSQRADVLKKSAKDYMEESDESSDEEDRKIDEIAVKSGLIPDDGNGAIPSIPKRIRSDVPSEEHSLFHDAKVAQASGRQRKVEPKNVYRVDDILSVGIRPERIQGISASDDKSTRTLTSSNGYLNEEETDNVYENDRDNESRMYRRIADDTLTRLEDEADIQHNLGSNRFKDSVLSRINDNIDMWLDRESGSAAASVAVESKRKDPNDSHLRRDDVREFVRPSVKSVPDSEVTNEEEGREGGEGVGGGGSIFDMMAPQSREWLKYFLQRRKHNEGEEQEEKEVKGREPTEDHETTATTAGAPAARPMLVSKYQSSLASFVAMNESFKNRFTSSTTPALVETVPKEGITTAAELAVERQKQANESASDQLLSSLTATVTSATPPAKLINKRTSVLWAPHSLLCKRMNIKPPEVTLSKSSEASSSSSRTEVRIESLLGQIERTEDTSYRVILTETDRHREKEKEKQREKEEGQKKDHSSIELIAAPSIELGTTTSHYTLSRQEKKRIHDENKANRAAREAAAAAAITGLSERKEEQMMAGSDTLQLGAVEAESRGVSEEEVMPAVTGAVEVPLVDPSPAPLPSVVFVSRSQRQNRSGASAVRISSGSVSRGQDKRRTERLEEEKENNEEEEEEGEEAREIDKGGVTTIIEVDKTTREQRDDEEEEEEDPLLGTNRRRRRGPSGLPTSSGTASAGHRRKIATMTKTKMTDETETVAASASFSGSASCESGTEEPAAEATARASPEGDSALAPLVAQTTTDSNASTAEAFLQSLEETPLNNEAVEEEEGETARNQQSEIERLIANYNSSIRQFRSGGGGGGGAAKTTATASSTNAASSSSSSDLFSDLFRSVPWAAERSSKSNNEASKHKQPPQPHDSKRKFDSIVQKIHSQLQASESEDDDVSSDEEKRKKRKKEKKHKHDHKHDHRHDHKHDHKKEHKKEHKKDRQKS